MIKENTDLDIAMSDKGKKKGQGEKLRGRGKKYYITYLYYCVDIKGK